jgi:DNA invertase Pin-like site-specific DNA recombinase
MRVVGYTRERPPATGAESAFGQGERIRRLVSEHGHELVALCTDAHAPDGDTRRAGFRAAIAVIEAGSAAALVVADLDALDTDLATQEVLLHRVRTLGVPTLSCDPADDKQLLDDPADAVRGEIRRTLRAVEEVAASLDG